MIVTVKEGGDAGAVGRALAARGLWALRHEAGGRVLFLVSPHSSELAPAALLAVDGVESVAEPAAAHPRLDAQPKVVSVSGVRVGHGAAPVVIAGPCSVESQAQIRSLAGQLAALGVSLLRGGAYKPRSSPYAFAGHGEQALRWLSIAARETGLKVVTECLGAEEAPLVAEHADLVQIGSRNMHNYALLKSVARLGRPILLKRGMAATVEEWLLAGECCLVHGAPAVIFCERGVRGFDPQTRNLLDLGAVALLAGVHRLPVIVDPSHGAGRRDLIAPLARAAIAVGASGLLIETHDDPGCALSDGPQALSPAALGELLSSLPSPEVSHG